MGLKGDESETTIQLRGALARTTDVYNEIEKMMTNPEINEI